MDSIQKILLEQIADLHGVPEGAYNIRANGTSAGRNTTANIDIVTKEDKPGIDIIVKPGTKNESVHIPVIISESGLEEDVYNDFFCVLNRIYLVSGHNGEVNILCADDVAAGLSRRAFKLRRLNGVARRVVKFKRRLLRVVGLNVF